MCIAVGKVSFDDWDMFDVVIRVNRCLRSQDPARQFDRPIGNDFVDVHVGLRARAGLPDPQGELAGEACHRSLRPRPARSSAAFSRAQLAQFVIDLRRRAI